jgi:hypothetical protein
VRLSSTKPMLSWLDMADAPVKKNKKKKNRNEEEHEAGLAELPVDTHATSEHANFLA